MSQDAPAESGNESGARCVLWHARDARPPAELLGALARRGLVVRAVQDGFAALAELCLIARSKRAILLLVEPDSLSEPQDVLAAARRYTPGAMTWVYEPGANKPLRVLVEEKPVDRPQTPAPSGHALRLTGEGPEHAMDWPDDDEELDMAHLLTDEELSMLLDEPRTGGSADVD